MKDTLFPVLIEQKQKIGNTVDNMSFQGRAKFYLRKENRFVYLELKDETGLKPYLEIEEISKEKISLHFMQNDVTFHLQVGCKVKCEFPYGKHFIPLTVVLKEKLFSDKEVRIVYHFVQGNEVIENFMQVRVI